MESDRSFIFLISHVFIAKPVSTFAKHALSASAHADTRKAYSGRAYAAFCIFDIWKACGGDDVRF
jgi:hypothetical protein